MPKTLDIAEETKPLSPDEWENMTPAELIDQKNILVDRIFATQGSQNTLMIEQLHNGLERLDAILTKKTGGTGLIT